MKAMASSVDMACAELQFYPPKQWGLDYQFNCFNKMYISDILDMPEYPQYPGAFAYKNHPIYKVDILGIVVKRTENSKCFIYAVDDGTGVILCCCWKEEFYRDTGAQRSVEKLPCGLQQKKQELYSDSETAEDGYALGDLVHMKGKMKIFRDKKEVVASYHKKINDPSFQVFRMCELPRLYKQCYDKPFCLPIKVQQALNMSNEHSDNTSVAKSDTSLALELKTVINDYLAKSSHIVDLPVNDLLQYEKVKDFLKHLENDHNILEKKLSILTHALMLMEGEGLVTSRSDRRMTFEVLIHKSKLEQRIMSILKTEVAKSNYSEKGCHYLHLLDELHKTFHYGKVKKEALMFCLQKLESQSDVIRTTHAHYIPCV